MDIGTYTLALFTFFFFESYDFCSQLNISKCSLRKIPEAFRIRNSFLFIFESCLLQILAKIWPKILWSRCWHCIVLTSLCNVRLVSRTFWLVSNIYQGLLWSFESYIGLYTLAYFIYFPSGSNVFRLFNLWFFDRDFNSFICSKVLENKNNEFVKLSELCVQLSDFRTFVQVLRTGFSSLTL